GPRDHQFIANPKLTMRLRDDAIDRDPSHLALPLRFRSGLEQTSDVEPHIETDHYADFIG
ncbi:hypothetical protein RSW37_26635, partial [Escherichia coli]